MTLHDANVVRAIAVVVNDEPIQLKVYSELLRRAGLMPLAFETAEAALADMVARAANPCLDTGSLPALIVTDLYMPGIDGWRFCRLLRSPQYAAFNQVPLLVVSATFSGEEPDRIAADIGANCFLHAPVEGRRFIEKVNAILQGRLVRPPVRVLIVEDSRSVANLLKSFFAAHGYQADTVATAQQAGEVFSQTVYDIAVLDYNLPDGTGDVLLDNFRAQQPGCVCLMMTANPDPALALNWMKRGAAAYLHKPFEPEYLIELCARARRERTMLRVQDLLEVRTRELRESETNLRQAQEIARLGRWELDLVAGRLTCSEGIYNLLEIDRETFTASKAAFLQFIHPDDRALVDRIYRTSVENKKTVYEAEYRLQMKDGRIKWVSESGRTDYNADGKPVRCVGTVQDVTERKRAEEALRKSEKNYQELFDHSPVGIFLTDSTGRANQINREAARILGASAPAEVFEKYQPLAVSIYADPQRRSEFLSLLQAQGKVENFEYEAIHLSGRRIWLSMNASIRKVLPDGTFLIDGFMTDITERKQAEKEHEILKAQLNQAQKIESVGRLAGGVAHDFNNMLNVILGYTELALENIAPDQPLYSNILEIQKAALQSAGLTQQLLAFARRQTIAPKVLDLNKTVESMLNMLRRLIGENIDLAWLPGRHLWPVKMDPSQINQILANLCVNARDAINGIGNITICTDNIVFDDAHCAEHPAFVPGEHVLLAISDNGCGMKKDVLDKLFEPFFTTKELGKGTGLGLSTVYGIVKQNNGFIDVHSEPAQGTTFRIHLPPHKGKPEHKHAAESTMSQAQGCETILLVEDEPAILGMTVIMLERQGYSVLPAATPGEAIRMAEAHGGMIDLLLTDVVMPEMNGRDLARNLRLRYPNLRLLFMSGYTADVIAHQGVLDPDVHFIQKPFSKKNLAAKVREVLDSAIEISW